MFLIILDKNPYEAAVKIPEGYKHKQLLELMQMISCVVDFGYKQLPNGKEIKNWIKKNKLWVCTFAEVLMDITNLSSLTYIKYKCLCDLLYEDCKDIEDTLSLVVPNAKTAVFRYVKEYKKFTEYETNTELPIEIAVKEYEKYMNWKKEKGIIS